MRTGVFVTFALIAGCTSSLEQVKAMREQAPEWYEARKTEFRGEGYPTLSTIPVLDEDYKPKRKLALSEQETLAALELFREDPRGHGAIESAESILAWASEARRAVEGQIPAPDFLTDDEIAALKARFDVPRGRL
ncbi:MAG: hypothetical protein AAGB16_03190 [Pseudomonadota bacterium]